MNALSNDIKNHMIISGRVYVSKLTKMYSGYGLPYDDLFQEGMLGLMKAVDGYDHTKNVKLETYASYFIKSAILEYVRNNISIVRQYKTKQQKKDFFKKGYVNDLSWDVEDDVQSTELDEDQSNTDILNLSKVWNNLDPRSQDILQSRYLSNDVLSLKEIGKTYNISQERVRQIEKKALHKLKSLLGE